ncbi:MAG TPA: 3-deoxy-D-manno-octulosonic acid transferase [Planctomycetes bacterium]|nr:3-deoxy-D-manno-octulosonic acid transferase [Planctomycetota bacterium]
MPWLRNLVYLLLIVLLLPKLIYSAVRHGKYRQGFAEKFLGFVPRTQIDASKRCIWFHAVSVGEVNLLQTLIQEIEQRDPQCQCVISTTTRTGYELARKKYAPRTVFYCPLDFSWAVKTALRRIQPHLLVLVELELWPNLIHFAAKQTKVVVVNGRLSANSTRGYRRLGFVIKPTVRQLDHIAVQNDEYYQRFLSIGAATAQLTVTGSIKFDGAQSDRQNERTVELKRLAGISDTDFVIIAGSTQVEEEKISLHVLQQLLPKIPQLKLVIVPRHPERFDDVARAIEQTGLLSGRRSTITKPLDPSTKVILVDAVGELGAWWGLADIGFVGGSMGKRGGQNMIEPAAYGVAVCFGPNTTNFRDIVEMLLANNAAQVVHDQTEFEQFVLAGINDPIKANKMGQRAKQFVHEQQGATTRSVDILFSLLD